MAYKPKVLALADGGTNANLTASNGGILYSTASAGAILAGTATANQVLMSGSSTTPAWSTATYPATAGTSGNVLTSNGTNWTSTAPASGISSVSSSLTNAQIKALHGTPISVISAPGSGKVILIVKAIGKMVYGGSNVFTAGAGQSIECYYGAGTTDAKQTLLSNANIVASSTQAQVVTDGSTPSTTYSSFDNQAIYLYNPVATEITGNAANNNTVSFVIYYVTATI